jgi:hypothetical protein
MGNRPLSRRERLLVQTFAWLLILAFAGLVGYAILSWSLYDNPRGPVGTMVFGVGLAIAVWFARQVRRDLKQRAP